MDGKGNQRGVDGTGRMRKEMEVIPTIQKRIAVHRTCFEGKEISTIAKYYTRKNPGREFHRKETKLMAEKP